MSSRRDFLKGLGIATAAAAVPSVLVGSETEAPKVEKAPKEEEEQRIDDSFYTSDPKQRALMEEYWGIKKETNKL